MIPGINPKQMKDAMKKMGMKQEEIEAEEVIIKCHDKEIIVDNPQVMKINMMGQSSLQITGNIREQEITKYTDEDVRTVMEQANCSEEAAKEALKDSNGELAEAILKLKR
jgi:nascent polypeptide-associated complex subunit alpha